MSLLIDKVAKIFGISDSVKFTIIFRLFVFFKVPVLSYLKPTVVRLDERDCIVKIPFKRRVKNHMNSVFVGVLTSGADCASILAAMHKTRMRNVDVVFSLKTLTVNFKKRAESDVYFTCAQGLEISEYVDQALRTGERLNRIIKVVATCPDTTGDEPVAEFEVTLSLRSKKPKVAKDSKPKAA